MPNKAEKSKAVAQAAALESSPSTPKPNKKRTANNNLNNPRSSQKVEETRVGSATADVKNATSPAPSLSEHPCPKATNKDVDTASPPAQSLSNPRSSHNDAKPSTKNTGIGVKDAKPQAHSPSPDLLGPETNKPEEGTSISHEDDYVSIKIKLAEDSNTDGEFVSVQDLQSEELLELPRVGHLQAADGTLKTVILSIKRRGVEYRIVFSNPPKDQDRTIAHDCMDLYVQEDYFGVGDLLLPLCEPIFNEADNNPISANKFQRFLQSAVTYLRLIPTTPAIEPYLGFLGPRTVDWDKFLRLH
ncbi:hypothetical protein ASPCAL04947 [Aspergillus calidoustus]|uniref:Uncharacterized protein n=1 Tax=Aspergillus calidoustus TaxID=454130 RepID=A0A0U5C695_ASPCI|nr:hypothetical protein ASPCAL04947 [Aspergillus calidoustus]